MQRKRTKRHFGLEIFAGFLLIGIGLLAFVYLKGKPPTQLDFSNPLARYKNALRSNKPVVVFFHSTNCKDCVLMIDVVNQIYPPFSEQVELIDLVVSEPGSRPLMAELNIRAIPAMIIVDSAGKTRTVVGLMEAELLQVILLNLTQNP